MVAPSPISLSASQRSASSFSTQRSSPMDLQSSFNGTMLTSLTSSMVDDARDDDIIPPGPNPRTLILCFDGTGDQFDTDNSNVILLNSLLMKDRPTEQLVYYQAGIGTYTIPEIATPMWANFSETMDMMIAWNLDAHVMGGYEFLMNNYQAGDKICLFGFSRGAYTARAVAGMVHKVGLLPRSNHQQVPFAYHMFSRTDELGWKQSTAFKKTFSMDVDIDFIGVWDTVCSVGLIPKRLPFTMSNDSIRVFRHALSLDEHRAKFKANHYNYPSEDEAKLGIQPGDMPKSGARKRTKKKGLTELEEEFSQQDGHHGHTDVLEVWFAGCHCDVGGGSVSNEDTQNLARIPLRWMIRQCFLTKTGIRFHSDLLHTVGLDPASLFPYVKQRPPAIYSLPSHPREATAATLVDASLPGNEEEEDYKDALRPIYDQLTLARYWWLLEIVPLEHRRQSKDHKWTNKIYVNLGGGREIPEHQPFYVHRSVKTRLEAHDLEGGPYKPKCANFDRMQPIWVD
ncbi:uncharacterized protein FIBRA_00909 [Fibroporia radiculosa]|uniref:T6SS Phospholipase effector Tle1-like catalytic domain-containing protein n=1 Tax=Fibroporia radiculosa TaxID=599839 RepID=J4HSG2_9APHY|nr:uncharacterized protein FIBRA_00909 [Fibroporia radiculosa]CCL98902.1 predicted protein [Fibroporia radiculosa]